MDPGGGAALAARRRARVSPQFDARHPLRTGRRGGGGRGDPAAAAVRDAPFPVVGRRGGRVPPLARRLDPAAARQRLRAPRPDRDPGSGRRRDARALRLRDRRLGAEVARGGDLASAPAAPLLLASTSPRRREILEQLRIPFDVVAPRYEETEDDPVAHALGKARSVLGCDTEAVCDDRVYGRPAGPEEAEEMLESLAGRTHEVVSGLALITPMWEEVRHEVTRVTFRGLTPRDLARYVASGEWEGRAGGYAIQGEGAALVERIEGDYLNVVGLPTALLVRVLAERFPGTYGFG